jgi:hypothetical protein
LIPNTSSAFETSIIEVLVSVLTPLAILTIKKEHHPVSVAQNISLFNEE